MNRKLLLFSDKDWIEVKNKHKCLLDEEINNYDRSKLTSESDNDIYQYFVNKYQITQLELLDEVKKRGNVYDTRTDISKDPNRGIRDRTKPFYINFSSYDFMMSFSGDAWLFSCKPTNMIWNLVEAMIDDKNKEIVITIYKDTNNKTHDELTRISEEVTNEVKSNFDLIERHISNINKDVNEWNSYIMKRIIELLSQRILTEKNSNVILNNLPFKLHERKDSKQIYLRPTNRRPSPNKSVSIPNNNPNHDPKLSEHDYDHIINVMENMASVMELSPSVFKRMKEEDLRWHFLVQLNGHYEGDATGETFNYEGKTDILVKYRGKNIFIGECKYWGGEKKVIETMDQILGYCSWRDTRAAIIFFNRNKNFTKIVNSIENIVVNHSGYKHGTFEQIKETVYRFKIKHKDDPDRILIITVLLFNIPQ